MTLHERHELFLALVRAKDEGEFYRAYELLVRDGPRRGARSHGRRVWSIVSRPYRKKK